MKAKPSPPNWATRLLHWYCAPHLLNEIEGDLREEFDFQVRQAGLAQARLDYILNVLGFIRPVNYERHAAGYEKERTTHRQLQHV